MPEAPSPSLESSCADHDGLVRDDPGEGLSGPELRDVPGEARNDSVQVIVRVRPTAGQEGPAGEPCLEVVDSQRLEVRSKHAPYTFEFDAVLPASCSQLDVFDLVGMPVVDNCLSGYNATVFAYGQTGSGKTHTMIGPAGENTGEMLQGADRGLAPRVFEYLFNRISADECAARLLHGAPHVSYSCSVSCLELYNNEPRDLLRGSDPENLQIREHRDKGPYVQGLTELPALNAGEMLSHLIKGVENRHKAATCMNDASSRSHAIFTINVAKRVTSPTGAVSEFSAKLNLVDLAGSERFGDGAQRRQSSRGQEPWTRAGTSKGGAATLEERSKETCGINLSLTALGNVISKLAKGGSGVHVPYRDSKLTYLLKESLGGNARTFFIAAVSPSPACADETLSTLRFAADARAVRNAARVAVCVAGGRGALQREVEALRAELEALRASGGGAAEARAALLATQRANADLEERCCQLSVAMAEAQSAVQAALQTATAESERSAALAAEATAAQDARKAALQATAAVEQCLKELAAQVAGAQSAAEAARKETALERERSTAAKAEAANARTALASAQEHVANLEARCDGLQASLHAARQEAALESERNAALAVEVARLRSALLAAQQHEQKCKQLAGEAAAAQSAAHAARLETAMAGERCTALVTEVSKLRAALGLAHHTSGEREEKCKQLATELAAAQRAAEQARADAAAQGAALAAQAAEARAAHLAAQQANSALKEQCRQLESSVSKARSAAQKSSIEASANAGRVKAAEVLAAEAAEARAGLLRANEALRKRCDKLAMDLEEVKSTSLAKEKALVDRTNTLAVDVTKLRAELMMAQQANAELEQKCKRLAAQEAAAQSAVHAAQQEASMSGERTKALAAEVARLWAAVLSAQQSNTELEEKCKQREAQEAKAQEAAHAARLEASMAGERSTALAAEVARLWAALLSAQQANTELEETCKQRAAEATRADSASEAATRAALSAHLAEARAAHLAAQQANTGLQERCTKLEAAASEARAAALAARQKETALTERARSLAAEVAEAWAAHASADKALQELRRQVAEAQFTTRTAQQDAAYAACASRSALHAKEAEVAALAARCKQHEAAAAEARAALEVLQRKLTACEESSARHAAEAAEAGKALKALRQQRMADSEGAHMALQVMLQQLTAAVEERGQVYPAQAAVSAASRVHSNNLPADMYAPGTPCSEDHAEQTANSPAADASVLQRQLLSAVERNDLAVVKQLLSKLKDHAQQEQEAPQRAPCGRGRKGAVGGARLDTKAKARGRQGGHTSPHAASRKGHKPWIKTLSELRKKVDVNALDTKAKPASRQAGTCSHKDLAQALLKASKHSTITDKECLAAIELVRQARAASASACSGEELQRTDEIDLVAFVSTTPVRPCNVPQ